MDREGRLPSWADSRCFNCSADYRPSSSSDVDCVGVVVNASSACTMSDTKPH
jgi:hypothetical protein